MVKCPRGSPSQVRANLAYINRPSTLSSNNDLTKCQMEKESETLVGESEGSEFDSIKADKRCPPTARDELVYFFISSFLDILLQSWDGKPCLKRTAHPPYVQNESEDFGEDLGPCELSIVSSTADYLKDLYRKRSCNLSKEKLKKDSESAESEYLNEEDFDSPPPDRWKTINDEDVHFVLLNGVWYKGRVSRKLMEGEGYYFWEDGTTFQGEFEGGCATGRGRLEFPDLSTYEGGVYKGFRHGEGMFCFSDSPVMYSGQWWLGKKHGHGLIVYNDPSEGHNFYKGQWQDGVKEGFGFRQYPSGAKYLGFWSNGTRHGKGVMFWSNHDIYRGEWRNGLMHGYGEYTWNGFINKSLSYPANNTYRGYWKEGKRNGRGLLELKSGCLIETTWVDDMKEGLGAVICGNGAVVTSERLFVQDKPVEFDLNKQDLRPAADDFTHREHLSPRHGNFKKLKVIPVPINSPVHHLNLYPHTQKLFQQLNSINFRNLEQTQLESEIVTVTPKEIEESGEGVPEREVQNKKFIEMTTQKVALQLENQRKKEENLLRNYIILKMTPLRRCYDSYATLPCEKKPPFECVLLRLFLWQMLIDWKIPNSTLSLIDIDDILAAVTQHWKEVDGWKLYHLKEHIKQYKRPEAQLPRLNAREEHLLIQDPHDPFERIPFWQFIQILIVLSWKLYGQYVLGELPLAEEEEIRDFVQYFGSCECYNVLKVAFQYFLEKHMCLGESTSDLPSDQGNRFEESDFAPMEAMYLIYCNVGEPHSARDFVNAICSKGSEDADVPKIVRYFEKLPFYKVDGKNAFTVAGELQHIPMNETFNIPELFQLERHEAKLEPKSQLTCFNGLKAKRVVKCLLEVCPGIMVDDCIVNMDYKLTFLEFYKAIILCTKLQLKMQGMNEVRERVMADYQIQLEEYFRQLNEFEKQKETQVASRKRSRQFTDVPKKGKK